MFKGAEAVKHMPAIPPKFTDKEKILIKDPAALEIEAEVDRLTLCEKIVEKMSHMQIVVPVIEQPVQTVANKTVNKKGSDGEVKHEKAI